MRYWQQRRKNLYYTLIIQFNLFGYLLENTGSLEIF